MVGRVSRLARELEARLEPVYREHGLEPGWHDVLATLRRTGPPYRLRPSDFTGSLMLTSLGHDEAARQARAGRPDRPLARPGRPPRRDDHAHRRRAGALIDRVTEAHMANEARLLEGLSAPEREQLADLLRKLALTLPPR